MVKFVKLVAEASLYVHLRIGPYVCAEWNYGFYAFSLLIIDLSVIKFIGSLFQGEMQRFTTKIVGLLKQEKLYASQLSRRTIILSQVLILFLIMFY
ncbi:hypothetical protein Patl1_35244 [Pistacia atlantica]|uniref:Uncharacterized protein n=1 Tax=Pistacia atlantica TaxID=434234 RepID=A0ACC0ZUE6_9ROSI|nr:hypothetical protein Patl1_35244 [Pistacia atlantica]